MSKIIHPTAFHPEARTVRRMQLVCLILMCIWVPLSTANSIEAVVAQNDRLSKIDSMETLLRENPQTLANDVIQDGRIRFLGIAGIGIEAPGISYSVNDCYPLRRYVYVVPGTSDVGDKKHFDMQNRSYAFAMHYNRLIEIHLYEHGQLKSYFHCYIRQRPKDAAPR